VRAWRAAYAGLLPDAELAALEAESEAAAWRRYILTPPSEGRLWLAVEGSRVVGFARTGPCADDDIAGRAGEVHGLYVEPELIGTGVGRRLLSHALDDLASREFELAVLWHFVGNDPAAAFYERAGLELDGSWRASAFGIEEVRRRLRLS
jgi:ribosomal protein S18 acetylase RimI-like enzyme